MVEYRAFLFKILHNKCLKIYDKTSKQLLFDTYVSFILVQLSTGN